MIFRGGFDLVCWCFSCLFEVSHETVTEISSTPSKVLSESVCRPKAIRKKLPSATEITTTGPDTVNQSLRDVLKKIKSRRLHTHTKVENKTDEEEEPLSYPATPESPGKILEILADGAASCIEHNACFKCPWPYDPASPQWAHCDICKEEAVHRPCADMDKVTIFWCEKCFKSSNPTNIWKYFHIDKWFSMDKKFMFWVFAYVFMCWASEKNGNIQEIRLICM